ncbi:TPA: tail fiber protein [Yersinia enterocolitica]|nr:tail fiber protein [Yersinia enterocolitica]
MTIVRGQEGTVSRLWSANDISANMMTAGTLDLFAQSGTLGGAALLNVGTTVGTVAAGDDPRITASLLKANNLSDLTNVPAALSNLGLGGLGSGSALPVGVPVPWPTATPPTGWIKCNGASFSASTYPQLAVIFPALVLPDLRGEFIRGWDDGRGIDAGRVLLSDQLGTFVSVDINYADSGLVGAIGTTDPTGGIANVNGDTITTPLTKTAFQYANVSGLAATTSLPGNTVATRPRNIAFNYIVRAA